MESPIIPNKLDSLIKSLGENLTPYSSPAADIILPQEEEVHSYFNKRPKVFPQDFHSNFRKDPRPQDLPLHTIRPKVLPHSYPPPQILPRPQVLPHSYPPIQILPRPQILPNNRSISSQILPHPHVLPPVLIRPHAHH